MNGNPYMERITSSHQEDINALRKSFQDEMSKMRQSYDLELLELKKVIMMQDSFYDEKIKSLEDRLQNQNRHICNGECRKIGNTVPSSPPVPQQQQQDIPASIAAEKISRPKRKPCFYEASVPRDKTVDPTRLREIVAKFQLRIDAVYDFYTISHADLLHPSMNLSDFTKFVRDCRLCDKGCTPELLWMSVMRAFAAADAEREAGKTSSSSCFAVQRMDCISRQQFSEALATLSEEWRSDLMMVEKKPQLHARRNSNTLSAKTAKIVSDVADKPAADVFIAFLERQVLPLAEARISKATHQGKGLSSVSSSRLDVSTFVVETLDSGIDYDAVIEAYRADESVKTVLKEFAAHVKKSFNSSLDGRQRSRQQQQQISPGITVEAFVEMAQQHGLLPLITKMELKHIFDHCCAYRSASEGNDLFSASKQDTTKSGKVLPMSAYVNSLCCLADTIYGGDVVASRYPTGESRMRKLLTKLFLLPTA